MLLEVVLIWETDKAYIAGIVDGEGCVTIYRRKCKGTRTGLFYTSGIVVVNTHKGVIDFCHQKTGLGTVCVEKKKTRNRPAWRLSLQAKQALELLEVIEPYLIVKKSQAEVLRRFVAAKTKRNWLSDEEWQRREDLYLEMRKLNERKAA